MSLSMVSTKTCALPILPANASSGHPQACLLRGGTFLEVSMTLVLGGDESPLTPSGQMFYASDWRVNLG